MIAIEDALKRYFNKKTSFGYSIQNVAINHFYVFFNHKKYIFFVSVINIHSNNCGLFRLNILTIMDRFFNIDPLEIGFESPMHYNIFNRYKNTIAATATSFLNPSSFKTTATSSAFIG